MTDCFQESKNLKGKLGWGLNQTQKQPYTIHPAELIGASGFPGFWSVVGLFGRFWSVSGPRGSVCRHTEAFDTASTRRISHGGGRGGQSPTGEQFLKINVAGTLEADGAGGGGRTISEMAPTPIPSRPGTK